MHPRFKSDPVLPDAGVLNAGFGDESEQLAFGICTLHQALEDSECGKRAWRCKVNVGNLAADVRSMSQTDEEVNQVKMQTKQVIFSRFGTSTRDHSPEVGIATEMS